MDDAALTELAANIKTHGVLQPILVRPVAADGYEIVCGERRWRASKTAGRDSIPARIMNLSDAEALELAVIENVQRENVHELDEAFGYKALMQQNPENYKNAKTGDFVVLYGDIVVLYDYQNDKILNIFSASSQQ